jgi:glyoxylase-like metal-dependent hydrolase (beta-lactamase superfamily II)
MNLYTIDTGNFKLDGGAMFGVVPKTIWNKVHPSDDNNMCNWAMRCMLLEDGKRLVLIDNGVGDKQDDKFFSHYYLNGDASLSKSLRKHGFTEDDITDVFLTHLHFDHCGGSVKWKADKSGYEPAFKNALYWSNERHWEWATHPNAREKASFLKENILPISESGQLCFIKDGESLFEGFKVREVNGHTEGMMLPEIQYGKKTILYCADLIPSMGHVPLPWIMAYDMRPLVTLEEKTVLLNEAAANDTILFFEHDLKTECCSLVQTEKGVKAGEAFPLSELMKTA